MRQDAPEFAALNTAGSKEPRLVSRIIFDVASIYITSDENMVNVPGTALLGNLQRVSAVSQEIHPDDGRSTIGQLRFSVVDVDSALTDALRDQLQTELQNLRGRRVELRLGYTADYLVPATSGEWQPVGWQPEGWQPGGWLPEEAEASDKTNVLFTQQVTGVNYTDGVYDIRCQDIQREQRKEIFEAKVTNLRLSVSETDTTIPVQSTTGFQTVFHGPSYSDSPSSTVGYIRIDDEFIRYTGTTADTFTGCTRGVFNTVPAEHKIESGSANDRQPEVEEIIYLELPGPKLAYSILTGVLHGDSATLPPHWNLGISVADVTLDQFEAIGLDLWDTSDDTASMLLRFLALAKSDGKQFLEEQIYRVLGLYSPVLNDGTLGLRRMVAILADAPYVMVLDESVFTQVGALEHDYRSLINVIKVDWNFDPIADRFTRRRIVIDQDSIDIHGDAPDRNFEWRGIHGSRHTDNFVNQRIDSIRDRYSGPPLRMSGKLLHSSNVLEVGDVVRVQLAHIRDYTGTGSSIDRSFEIQRIAADQISGDVIVSLFGSSQPASVTAPDQDANPMPDSWYSSAGTELSTVVTIVAGVIQAGSYNLTGNTDLKAAGAIYYYEGDLELADGATLTINDNVQLRIRGFFTVNGDIDGVGRGKAGVVDAGAGVNRQSLGNVGWVGNTRPWNGILQRVDKWVDNVTLVTEGQHSAFPFLQLSSASGTLSGLPSDLRGTSGGHGGRIFQVFLELNIAKGGDGGDSGAGLAIICRGLSAGLSANIDLSGADSAAGEEFVSGLTYRAGYGAPGGPGSMLVLLDGSGLCVPSSM